MDVRMPGIDGVEAFRQIRVHQPDVRMIIMTAYSTQELEQVALDEGAIAFLPKPLDIQKVLGLIGEVVKILARNKRFDEAEKVLTDLAPAVDEAERRPIDLQRLRIVVAAGKFDEAKEP